MDPSNTNTNSNASSSKLVRISDFCQSHRRSRRQQGPRRRAHTTTAGVGLGVGVDATTISDSSVSYADIGTGTGTTRDRSWWSSSYPDGSERLVDVTAGSTSFRDPESSRMDDDDEEVHSSFEHVAAVDVYVTILKSLPSLPVGDEDGMQMNHRCGSTDADAPQIGGPSTDDEYATVYTDDIQLLLELQVFNGQICIMVSSSCRDGGCETSKQLMGRTDSDRNDDPFSSSFVPVILQVISPEDISTSCMPNALLSDADADANSSQRSRYRVYIPPTVALSLGLHDYGCLGQQCHAQIASMAGYNMSSPCTRKTLLHGRDQDPEIEMATKVKIMEISPPPDDFMPSMTTLCMMSSGSSSRSSEAKEDQASMVKWRNDAKNRQIDLLQQYFYRCGTRDDNNSGNVSGNGNDTSKSEKKEAVCRLMAAGTMFAIVDDDASDLGAKYHQQSAMDVFDWRLRSRIRFYKVMEIESSSSSLSKHADSGGRHRGRGGSSPSRCYCCWVSMQTRLVLLPKEETRTKYSSISRLAPFSSIWSFRRSISATMTTSPDAKNEYHSSFMRKAWSHPSLVNVIESLFSMGSICLNLSRNNHASNLSLGSHLLHIVGNQDDHVQSCLDAAADSLGMNILHVGGLASFAYRYKKVQIDDPGGGGVPVGGVVGSILDKIAGIRSAFAVARKSAPCIVHFCLDQEIIDTDDAEARHDEENRLLSSFQDAFKEAIADMEGCDVSPILVVVSTEKLFQHGPISSSLLYDSVAIQSPDEAYARENWNDNDSFDEVKDQLLGRSANEISFLGKEFRQKKRDIMCSQTTELLGMESFSAKATLRSLLNCSDHVSMFHNSSKKLTTDLIPNVKWEDIGGLSHVRSEIIDAIELPLQHPDLFGGSSRRSGILFFGPPGSGKTLVAKAVASECGLPFLSVKGPELLGSYVGESESNIRAAFTSAREAAADSVHNSSTSGAAILFFDEIDSLAPRRGELGDGGGVMERVVSTLLSEMDKDVNECENPGQVFVIGATNRPDLLDPALMRPGRFDRIIYLGLARNREDRIQILAAQTRKFQFENGIDAKTMASKVIDAIPSSMSGADFSAIASGALMLALQRVCDEVDAEVASAESPDVKSVEDVVHIWPEDRLVPKVKVEDFINAAKSVHPSVSEDDIQKYESMRSEYCAMRQR